MATLFPHLTSTGPAPSSREVMTTYRHAFASRVAERSLRPLVLPYHLYGMLLLLVYLCIPHTQNQYIYAARWPVLALICAWQWKTLWEATSMSMATGFAAGLIAAWGVVWAITWLVWNRPQWDARRVQGRRIGGKGKGNAEHDRRANGSAEGQERIGSAVSVLDGDAEIRKRPQANGHTKGEQGNGHTTMNGVAQVQRDPLGSSRGKDGAVEYYWQPYPSNFRERLSWVIDLLMNFRGPGWNWAIPPLPKLPPNIKTALGEPLDTDSHSGVSPIGLQRFNTRRELFRSRVPRFIIGYFLLDIMKIIMKKDPYFTFGPNAYALPSHLQGFSPLTLRFIRQLISSISIIVSLEMTFFLAPLLVSLLLGPSVLGLRAEPWYYPTTWGSFSTVLTKGLNGLWGSWWHQTFRFIFSAPTNYFIRNKYFSPRSQLAKISALLFAFGISGFLHAGGSISQFPATHPTHAPIFFMLQAVGILLQMTFCSVLHTYLKKLPSWLKKGGNLAFTLFWLFETGWWLTDDFARGGIWLYEPIPVSVLRGLGLGDKGDGWWCWEHIGIGWYKGASWWESGIAL